MSLLSFHW